MTTNQQPAMFELGGLFASVDTIETTPLDLLTLPREIAPGVIVAPAVEEPAPFVIVDNDEPRTLTLAEAVANLAPWSLRATANADTILDATNGLKYRHASSGGSWDGPGMIHNDARGMNVRTHSQPDGTPGVTYPGPSWKQIAEAVQDHITPDLLGQWNQLHMEERQANDERDADPRPSPRTMTRDALQIADAEWFERDTIRMRRNTEHMRRAGALRAALVALIDGPDPSALF